MLEMVGFDRTIGFMIVLLYRQIMVMQQILEILGKLNDKLDAN
jgi:hypothetical protein